nr:unnamed protein product [Callosobruchus chinensis]
MEAYIHHTTKIFKPGSNGLFNKSCDIARRQVLALRTYRTPPSKIDKLILRQEPIQRNRLTCKTPTRCQNETEGYVTPQWQPIKSADGKVLWRLSERLGVSLYSACAKKGSKAHPSKYRPIALPSVMSKLMEKSVNQELMKYLELHQLINDRQYGFRHERSTGDLMPYVTHVWNKIIHSYDEAHVIGLDISKATDQLWHESLLNKISSFADDSTLHAGIMSNRPISVNELEQHRKLATAASLSNDLEAITAWGLRNMVEFNASKTQYCTLSNKRCPSEHSVLMTTRLCQEVTHTTF